MDKKVGWAKSAALLTTVILTGVFGWRATIGWNAYFNGSVDKFIPASLISIMLLGSLLILPKFQNTKKD